MMLNLHGSVNTQSRKKLKLGKKILFSLVLTSLLSSFFLPAVYANDIKEVRNEIKNVRGDVNNVKRGVQDVHRTVKDVQGIFNTGGKIVDDFSKLFSSFSGGGGGGGAALPDGDFELPGLTEYNGMPEESLRQYSLNVLNFALTFLGLIGVAAVIYSGFLYVTAGGDDGTVEKAKKIVIYAVIGILVVMGSYALVNTIIKEAAIGGDDRGGGGGGGGGVGIPSSFAPGTIIPAGTTLSDGTTLQNDTVVNRDGSVNLSDNNLANTDTLDLTTLLSFQNGITIEGSGVSDLGRSAIVSVEGAQAGLDFGLTVEANALFDFGDGTQGVLDTISSPGSTISHGFGGGLTYLIRVISQTADGKVHTFEKSLVVGGTTADFYLSRTQAVVGESVTLDARSSRASIGSIKSYNWSCSGTGNGCFPDIQGDSITVSFGEAGTYEITLLVENALGTTASVSKSITILNDKPLAKFFSQNAGNAQAPLTMVFNAGASENIIGDTQGLLYKWNFDGEVKQTASSNTSYEFSSEGTKTVTLEVSQKVGGRTLTSEEETQEVDVQTTLSPDFHINQ